MSQSPFPNRVFDSAGRDVDVLPPWLRSERVVEAGDGPRITRGLNAGREVVQSLRDAERRAVQRLLERLQTLRTNLVARLVGGNLTEFRTATLNQLIADTDRMIGDAQRDIERLGEQALGTVGELGGQQVDQTLRGAQLQPRLVGLDPSIVKASYDNLADLLTPSMQQFRTEVITSLRRVTLTADSKMAELTRLRDIIAEKGFDNAQFRAERILRTEIGRTFNAATYERLIQQAQDFPFLRKGWKATNDSRTRESHRLAARTYARGVGIKVEERFVLRPRKGPLVTLRFPSDPLAEPAGRPAAAETIMCRCHSFADFAPSEFAEFAKQSVSVALGNVQRPGTAPFPRVPAADDPPTPVRPVAPAPATPAPSIAPGLLRPPTIGPIGIAIGPKVDLQLPERFEQRFRDTLEALDKVHGDGDLPRIPLRYDPKDRQGTLAYYTPQAILKAKKIEGGPRLTVTALGVEHMPHLTLVHEVGHWLDEMALGDPDAVPDALGRRDDLFNDAKMRFLGSRRNNPVMAEWLDAVQGSQAFRNLFLLPNADPDHIRYLASKHELFARSYAQYVATRSDDPLLLGDLHRLRALDAGSYPRQWSDADFRPIAEAFDRMLATLRWRGPQPERLP